MKVQAEKLNSENAMAFKRELLAAVADGDLTLDMSAVRQADSSVVSVLLAGRRAAQERGAELEVVSAPAKLIELAKLYGTLELLGLKPHS